MAQAVFAADETAVPQTMTPTENETKNLGPNDQTRIDHLAQLSGKSKEEILKMRTEQHMGWGAIAKALGVPPGELGQAMRKDRKERNAASKLEKNERKEQRMSTKEKYRDHEDHKTERKSDK